MQTRLSSIKRKPDSSLHIMHQLQEPKKRQTREVKEIKRVVFYDPASVADMRALEKDSNIKMLGDAETQKQWPVLIYNSHSDYGFGAVAKRHIEKGEDIVPYLGDLGTMQDDELDEKKQAYAYRYDDNDQFILGHVRGSVAVFVNHNEYIPNVYCEKVNGQLVFKALCDIPAGCALLLNYGPEYRFTTRPLYLCPYRNGKNPTANLQQNKRWYEGRKIQLTEDLKRIFGIDSSDATHLIVPKIYNRPLLQKSLYKNLPIYLAKMGKKVFVLNEENQPYLTSLLLATAERDAPKIKKLLVYGADVFSETKNHVSVLRIAAQMLLLEDNLSNDFKDVFMFIVTKIHTHYMRFYEKDMRHSKFLSYINKHIDPNNNKALKLIEDKYSKENSDLLKTAYAKSSSLFSSEKIVIMPPIARQNVSLLKIKRK